MLRRILRTLAVAVALFLATTSAADEKCVFYVSGVQIQPLQQWYEVDQCGSEGCGFSSFNPKTRESVVVAKLASVPQRLVWQKDFKGLTYDLDGKSFHVDWKLDAAPAQPSHEDIPTTQKAPDDPATAPQWRGKLLDPDSTELGCSPSLTAPDPPCKITTGLPNHREIHVGLGAGCDNHFMAPVSWVNQETGEKRLLYTQPDAESAQWVGHLDLSTANSFILLATENDGYNSIVADLNTGEILMRAGPSSMLATWAACPSKCLEPRFTKN